MKIKLKLPKQRIHIAPPSKVHECGKKTKQRNVCRDKNKILKEYDREYGTEDSKK